VSAVLVTEGTVTLVTLPLGLFAGFSWVFISTLAYKTLLKSTHLGEWVIKVYVPKSMNTSMGCIYNVPLDITAEDIKDVLKRQNVSTCVRLTYYDKEKKRKTALQYCQIIF
jgi:hypothetical protein